MAGESQQTDPPGSHGVREVWEIKITHKWVILCFPPFFCHKPAYSFQVAAASKKRAQPLSTRKLY